MTVAVASRMSSTNDDFADMMAADLPARRWDVLVTAFSRYGLTQITYGFADEASFLRSDPSAKLAMSTMNPELMDRYFARGYHAFDPLLKYLRAGHLEPLQFDIDALDAPSETLTDIRALGVANGVLIPLPPLPGCPTAGLIVGSALPAVETRKTLDRHGSVLVALAHLFHARASGELMRRRDGVPQLTSREQACLQIISRGERVAAAAHQLGLSEATVELHLRNARHKLGARSRPEAVARGLLYRQIEPL